MHISQIKKIKKVREKKKTIALTKDAFKPGMITQVDKLFKRTLSSKDLKQ